MKKISTLLKHLIPWCVAIGIFTYLFQEYPPQQVWSALNHVKLLPFSLFSFGYFLVILLVDVLTTQKVIARFAHPVPFREVLIARGVTYLIMVVNYPASQAAFAYYFKRRHNIPIFESLGFFLFIMIIDLFWVTTLAIVGSFIEPASFSEINLGPAIQLAGVSVYAGIFLWMMLWSDWFEHKASSIFRFAFIKKIRERGIFRTFSQAHFSDYVRIGLLRIPIHASIILCIYVIMPTFHAAIPFQKILATMPVVFFIGTLPITPGGLGTVNIAMVKLLSPFIESSIFAAGQITPQEMMFAVTLLWMFSNYLLKIGMGGILLFFVSQQLFAPTPDVPLDTAEHEAAHLGGNL